MITTGRNDRQVRAIVDEVSRQVREQPAISVRQVEGLEELSWVLLDYGDFVVHVFDADVAQRRTRSSGSGPTRRGVALGDAAPSRLCSVADQLWRERADRRVARTGSTDWSKSTEPPGSHASFTPPKTKDTESPRRTG